MERRKRAGLIELRVTCPICLKDRWVAYSNYKQGTGTCLKCQRAKQRLPLNKKWNGRLTPIAVLKEGSHGKRTLYQFSCDCGKITSGYASKSKKSCGCLKHQPRAKRAADSELGVRHFWHVYKNSAKRKKRSFNINFVQFTNFTTAACYYCGAAPVRRVLNCNHGRKVTIHANGIDRVLNSKGYSADNCVTCCPQCNQAKSTMPQVDFIAWIHKVAVRHPIEWTSKPN